MGRADVRRWEVLGLLAYSALLAVALLAPTSATQSSMAGWIAGDWLTQARAEFVCNALILVPVSALGSLVWPRTTWRDWTAWTFVAVVLVEAAQGLVLPHRTPAPVDVVANTLGGLAGAVVILGVRRLRQPLERVVHSRPSGPWGSTRRDP